VYENFWSLILGLVQLAFCRDCCHWTPITSCESGAVVLHYQLCMRSAWKYCIYSVRSSTLWHCIENLLSNRLPLRVVPYSVKGMNCCVHMNMPQCYVICILCTFFSLMDANIFHKHKSVYSSLCSFLHPYAVSVTLGPGILHGKYSPSPSICVFPLGEGITFFTHVRQWAKSWYCVLFNWCVFWYLVHTLFSFWGFMPRWVLWITESCYVFHCVEMFSTKLLSLV
jgi:hypothetical protein